MNRQQTAQKAKTSLKAKASQKARQAWQWIKDWSVKVFDVLRWPPMQVYLAGVAALVAQLLIFERLIQPINMWLELPGCQVLADALVFMLPYWWLNGRWRRMVWIPIAGITVFCCANLWYCRAFYDLMPLESLAMGGNMQDRVIDAFVDQLRRDDLWLLVPVVLFAAVVWLNRGKWIKGKLTVPVKAATTMAAVIFFICVYAWRAWEYHMYPDDGSKPQRTTYMHMLTHYYHESAIVYKFTQHASRLGYFGYMIYQFHQTFVSGQLTAEQRRDLDKYWEERRQDMTTPGVYAANRGRNLIFLIVESLASDAVGMTVNGQAVTPTIDALMASDSTAIVAKNMHPQITHGRSSDGQFMYNTGLLPLRNSVVAKRHPSADYPSLAKALGYRQSAEVIGEAPTFYNHSTTNISYGYNGLVAATSGWFEDNQIFDNALATIADMKKDSPFFCLITTLTMHDPYNDYPAQPTAISSAKGYDRRDLNYLEQVHLFDKRLAVFVDGLKNLGVYDNSVIVIISDHEPRANALSENLITPRIFFMALNTGQPGMTYDADMGQVDIFPTMLQLMGVDSYEYPGLGSSILGPTPPQGAMSPYGDVFGNPDAAHRAAMLKAWDNAQLMVEGGYFR